MNGAISNRSELRCWVRENMDVVTDVLAAGSTEAKAYALTLLSEVGTVEDIEEAQRALERMKDEARP